MRIIYDLIISVYRAAISLAALFGNTKARQWIRGRKNWEEEITKQVLQAGENRVWFHCASLGEFEQGRPVIEKLKSNDPSIFVVLTFFSPSGFELRKNYSYADLVCYLPVDNRKNACQFIEIISPKFAIFVKYEFWIHYFEELKRNNIPLFVVSAVFRPSQIFFKWYGGFYRKALENVTNIFVQDENSKELLIRAGIKSITVSGDTRFDRVLAVSKEAKEIPKIELFRRDKKVLVAGSTWPDDESILFSVLSLPEASGLKLIVAPHEVDENRISKLVKQAEEIFGPGETIRYSSDNNPAHARIMIIDNIGLLSSLYGCATVAWIGGGFGKGIHNILEASVFGVPVLFGPEYKKFREAIDLVSLNGAFSVSNAKIAGEMITKLLTNDSFREKSSAASKKY